MRIRIVTDSASDITLRELETLGVDLAPIPLLCGNQTILDDKTRPMEEFWEMMGRGVTIKTSQPSVESYLSIFQAAKAAGEEVVCITISSQLSGTYQGACLAKKMAEYGPIYIVDSKNAAAAAAQKLLVYRACALQEEGRLTGAQIAAELERYRDRVRLYACIDTLEYLVRGGRLPRGVAGIGKIMQIKPIITLNAAGGIEVVKKEIGQAHAMREMAEIVKKHCVSAQDPIVPIYARTSEHCQMFLQKLEQAGVHLPMRPMEPIGATIGAYIGPGGYGIVFVEEA